MLFMNVKLHMEDLNSMMVDLGNILNRKFTIYYFIVNQCCCCVLKSTFCFSSGRSSMLEPKPPQESDTDSMQDYADAKFTEDGSFIGQYGKKKASDLPSPMATFV